MPQNKGTERYYCFCHSNRAIAERSQVDSMDAMEFFRRSAGTWKSQRTTHHLAFKRAEVGESEIKVEALEADHPDIVALCQVHEVDPSLAIGGAHVTWNGTMSWDREDEEKHEGETVFALVPDADDSTQGKILRERGYAEIMTVVGRYFMDEEGGLVMLTEYETMSSKERFWFASPDLRVRTSTVKRFGGFSTASFCTETRTETANAAVVSAQEAFAGGNSSILGW